MNLVRKYKISKLMNKPLTGIEREVIDFIDGWLTALTSFTISEEDASKLSPRSNMKFSSVYYMSPSGKFVFEDLRHNNVVNIRYDNFGIVLYQKFSLSNKDIDDILSFMIQNRFNFNGDVKIAYASSRLVDDAEVEYNKGRKHTFKTYVKNYK